MEMLPYGGSTRGDWCDRRDCRDTPNLERGGDCATRQRRLCGVNVFEYVGDLVQRVEGHELNLF